MASPIHPLSQRRPVGGEKRERAVAAVPVEAVPTRTSSRHLHCHPPHLRSLLSLTQVDNLKEIYRVVDKESYLDWGLTSDFESAEGAIVRAPLPESRACSQCPAEAGRCRGSLRAGVAAPLPHTQGAPRLRLPPT